MKEWTENMNTSSCSISRICQLYVYVWKFQEFWERICFFSIDENESLPSHLWRQLPCWGQLSLWRNISHKSHRDLLQTEWKCSLFNHGNAFLVSQKSWLEGGEEQFHCGGGGGKLSSSTHSWPPGLREAGRRYSDLRPVFTRSNDFDSMNYYPLINQRKRP